MEYGEANDPLSYAARAGGRIEVSLGVQRSDEFEPVG
jgi:hypothetical protein